MILYTPLALEDIFPYIDQLDGQEWIMYEGKTVCAKKRPDGNYELLQLSSSDPQDYMNESFAPGSIILQNIETLQS